MCCSIAIIVHAAQQNGRPKKQSKLVLLLCILCSKRKVLRAWKAAMPQRAPATAASEPDAAPGVLQAAPAASLNQQDAPQHELTRREQVAEQFHRLYRLHDCLQQWRRCTAAGALERCRQETDRIMAQQQAEVGCG